MYKRQVRRLSDAIVKVENLRKTFREEEVLKGITCEFSRGKTHAVIGNNGSGKSVFFKCVCGFIEPTKGHIIVGGKEIGKDIDFPESVGVIIERPGFLPNLSGYRNLQLLTNIRNAITQDQVKEAIRKVGLDPSSKKAVAKYSLGCLLYTSTVTDCVKAIGTEDSEGWAGLEDGELTKSVGYSVYLSPKAGDVAGYTLPRRMVYNDLPETMSAPSFLTEQIRVIITKEGVQRFEWRNISKRKDTVAENTKLLSFEEIKEKLAQHLLYVEVSEMGGDKQDGSQGLYKVEDVQLRAANINAYEDPDAVWLVPAWIFKVNHTLRAESAGQVYESNLGPDVIILNAIDGGYVKMCIRDRHLW